MKKKAKIIKRTNKELNGGRRKEGDYNDEEKKQRLELEFVLDLRRGGERENMVGYMDN